MSIDFEQRLRTQMDQVQVRLRPEIALEAHRAHRRHRAIRRSAAAGAVAVVAAIGVAVATGAVPFGSAALRPSPVTSRTPSQPTVPPASFQPTPAPDSLTRQQAAKEIFFTRRTSNWLRGESGDEFRYGASYRSISYDADHNPENDVSVAAGTKDGKATDTVTYIWHFNHTYWRFGEWVSTPAVPAHPAATLCAVAQRALLQVNNDPVLLTEDAGALLTCKGLTVTRGQRIDGIDAVTISLRNQKLWLNATTDLPIQLTTVLPGGRTTVTQYGYLPATPANLAHYLTSAVPHGFKRVGRPPVPEGFPVN